MTLKPKDYIAERRREISKQMQELKLEMEQLDRMESALGPDLFFTSVKLPSLEAPPPAKRRHRVAGGIKSLVLEVLSREGNGLVAQDILKEIKSRFDVELQRTSLSPQLSRLKSEGKVEVEHSVWKITRTGLEDVL